jgi:hypothetical protein
MGSGIDGVGIARLQVEWMKLQSCNLDPTAHYVIQQ